MKIERQRTEKQFIRFVELVSHGEDLVPGDERGAAHVLPGALGEPVDDAGVGELPRLRLELVPLEALVPAGEGEAARGVPAALRPVLAGRPGDNAPVLNLAGLLPEVWFAAADVVAAEVRALGVGDVERAGEDAALVVDLLLGRVPHIDQSLATNTETIITNIMDGMLLSADSYLLSIIYHLAVGDDGVVPAGPHGGAHVALTSKLRALALLDHTGASTLSARGHVTQSLSREGSELSTC